MADWEAVEVDDLPAEIAAFEAFKFYLNGPVPNVPFEWLTALSLSAEQWVEVASRMGWQALRVNLNSFARKGVFAVEGATDLIAGRLSDPSELLKARVQPYQLQMALAAVDAGVPLKVQAALETALEASLANVPVFEARIVVCPDVSGSMSALLTGYRKGATSKVRCIDIAALVSSALLCRNAATRVMPFAEGVVDLPLDSFSRVAANAAKLASIGGGGTNVSAPLARLNAERAEADLVVIVSDNESWMEATRHGATATLREWERLKKRCPGAKLVCIDLQPYGTTQAKGREDILNVGGFSDAVFDNLARFAAGTDQRDWVAEVNGMEI